MTGLSDVLAIRGIDQHEREHMKTRYYLSATALAIALLLSPAVNAGDCCTKTVALVQDGKACDKCADHDCCKDSAKAEMKKIAATGKKAGKCAGCEAKKKEKAS